MKGLNDLCDGELCHLVVAGGGEQLASGETMESESHPHYTLETFLGR